MLQGSAAFAALGALGLATAMPAYADTYGWGYASAVGAENTVAETYITQDQTVSESFSSGIGDWLTVTGTTTATVNAEGASGTTVIDTAKVSITLDDLEKILDPEADEDEEDDEDENNDGDDGDDDGDDDDNDGDDDQTPEDGAGGDGSESEDTVPDPEETDPESEDGSSEEGGNGEPEPEPTTPPVEEPTESPAPDGEGQDEDGSDDEGSNDASAAEVIELTEDNSELVDGGDTIVIKGTVTGATVSTSQSWDGDVSHSAFEGEFQESEASVLSNGEQVEVELVPLFDEGVVQTEDAGYLWNDAYTSLYVGFAVNGEVVAGYPLAESAAGITIGAIDDGDGGEGDGGEGGEGDTKTPPQKERDKETLPKTDATDAQPLATTGSPVLGLIAAGAAIAAGGGAAAYLARRKKNNDEVAETEAETTES